MYRRLVINESCVPPPVQPELTNAAVQQCFTKAPTHHPTNATLLTLRSECCGSAKAVQALPNVESLH